MTAFLSGVAFWSGPSSHGRKAGRESMDRPSPAAQALGGARRKHRPTVTQLAWLSRGLEQAGGKLPLFDRYGQPYDVRTLRSCLRPAERRGGKKWGSTGSSRGAPYH